jgi:hypothetical protein
MVVQKSDVSAQEQEPLKQGQAEVEEGAMQEGISDEGTATESDGTGEEGDTSTALEDDATSETDDGELSLDDFDEPEEEEAKRTGFQKRIDKLFAEKKAAEERSRQLEERLSRLETKKEETPEYSEAQLRKAMAKAIEEGDANLMYEIVDYRIKKAKKEAIEEERSRLKEGEEKQKRHAQEWNTIVEEYSYLSDPQEPELFSGSHSALNVSDQNSTVFKLATKLYLDPERSDRYQKDGGQRLAVSDAVRMILRKKNAKVQSKETKILKRQLVKEKQKSSVASGRAVKGETSAPVSSKTSLEEYMEERRKAKAGIAGGL